MKSILLTLFCGVSVVGFAKLTYLPCEKTYVDPFFITIDDKTIHIQTDGENIQTSTLYSDESGLFFQDILETVKKENVVTTDEPLDSYESTEEEVVAVNEETLEETPPPLINVKAPAKPTPQPKKKRCWPYGKEHLKGR